MERSDIQKNILKKFMYASNLKYNDIWDKNLPSNKFNYHLKLLVDEGILEKADSIYNLTSKGVHLISTLDGVAIHHKKQPLVCSFVLGYDDKKNKVLMQVRTKQPFNGVLGIPGGKLDFGTSTKEQAAIEFLEETGLSGDLTLKLITNYMTKSEDDDEMAHHMIGFMYIAKNLKGKLIEETREGKNIFISPEDIVTYEHYPDIPFNVKTLISNNSHVVFKEALRTLSQGKFTSIKFLDE